MPIHWPWTKRPGGFAAPEAKQARGAGWGFVALHGQSEASWTRRDYAALSREGFMRNPVVHRSVRLIAEAAAAVPWLLYDGAEELDAHPALDLMARPNQRQAGGSFFETLYGHLLLAGNAYVELVTAGLPSPLRGGWPPRVLPPASPRTGSGPGGGPTGSSASSPPPPVGSADTLPARGREGLAAELHLLRPDRVTVITDASGWPAALEHREGAGKRRIGLDSALHLSLFHPLDDHYGFPPLEAASMALDIHNAAGRWNKALLDNSARPSGALVYAPKEGGNLTEEQFERLKAELEQGYSGPARAGRPLLLEGGLDWKAMGLTPKDMDFVEAKHAAARDIALAFGVPPMLLGIPGDNTYANYQEANRALYRLTILPLVARTAKEFSAWLGPVFGQGLRFWYDADQIEGLAVEREALWARVGAAGFLSDDEKREAVGYGLRG